MQNKLIWKILAISIVLLMVINCITPSIAVGNLNDNALNRSVEAMMPFYASANATIYANQIPFYHSRINDEGNYHLSSVVMHVNVKAKSSIAWHDQDGMQIAKSQNKPTMILFYSDRCPACVKLTGEFADTRVINMSKNFVPFVGSRVLDSQYGIRYVPTIVFTNSQGIEVHRIVGYRDADTLVNGMQYALSLSPTLNVPFFSQRDTAWRDKKLDHSPYSIGEYGCALTSVAMVSKYFGYDTDPDRLNTSLTEVGGLDTSGILYWKKVEEVSDGTVDWIGRAEGNWSRIDQELSERNPVISSVNCPLGTHFIVFVGKSGDEHYFLDPYDEKRTIREWPNGTHGVYTLKNLRIYHGSPTTLREGDVVGRKVKIGFEHSHASYIDFDGISILSNSLNYSGIAYEHYDMVKPTIELNQFDGTLTKDKKTGNITFQLNQNPEAIVFSIFQKISGSYADLKLSITDPNGKRYWWIYIPPNRITTLHFHAPMEGEWKVEATVDEEYWDQIDCLNFNITLYEGKTHIPQFTFIKILFHEFPTAMNRPNKICHTNLHSYS